MLTLIGTIIGLLGSMLPEWLKLAKAKEDHKQELEILKVQFEMSKVEHQYKLEEINVQADVAESQALYQNAQPRITGVKWIDATLELYNGIVRPTVTFAFVFFYGLVKYAQYNLLQTSGSTIWSSIQALWSSEDFAVFSTIIAFYFGGRFLKYSLNKYGSYPIENGLNGHNHIPASLIPKKDPLKIEM